MNKNRQGNPYSRCPSPIQGPFPGRSRVRSILRPPLRAGWGLLILLAVLWFAPAAWAQGPIVLDGQFGDWVGQPHVDDPQGDSQTPPTDLQAFYFATNPNEEVAYFMAERWEAGAQPLELILRFDTNDNGNYDEPEDRIVAIRYDPRPGGSRVDMAIADGRGQNRRILVTDANWGEPQPGQRVEWGVTFADLGIVPFQNIRMQLFSMQGNQISDTVAEVQWSPANALDLPLLALLLLGGVAYLAYRRKRLS